MDTAGWALAIVCPNTEARVARRLRSVDVEHLIVKRRAVRIWRGRKLEQLRPAFPRYVWMRMATRVWPLMHQISDIMHLVSGSQGHWRVSDEVIDSLRSRLDRDDVLPIIEKAKFKFGERVIIRGSRAVSGHEAVFQFNLPNERSVILQEWLGQWVHVEIDERDLMSLGEYQSLRALRRKRKRRRSQRRAVAIRNPIPATVTVGAGSLQAAQ